MLEQGPLVGAGAVVRAPEGAGDWEFETGVQCLGGGGKLGRFVKRLQLACLPNSGEPTVLWVGCGPSVFVWSRWWWWWLTRLFALTVVGAQVFGSVFCGGAR